MTTRERKSGAVWLYLAPGLIIYSVSAVVGIYALVDGVNRVDPILIGLGLVVFSGFVYLANRLLRSAGIY